MFMSKVYSGGKFHLSVLVLSVLVMAFVVSPSNSSVKRAKTEGIWQGHGEHVVVKKLGGQKEPCSDCEVHRKCVAFAYHLPFYGQPVHVVMEVS